MIEHNINVGMSITYEKEILERDTLGDYGSEALDFILSTPSMVAILLSASSKLLNPLVPKGSITVGSSVELHHEKPTLLGEKIWMTVTVTEVAGDRISLEFSASDKAGVVAKGKHVRFVVVGEEVVSAAYERLGIKQ